MSHLLPTFLILCLVHLMEYSFLQSFIYLVIFFRVGPPQPKTITLVIINAEATDAKLL